MRHVKLAVALIAGGVIFGCSKAEKVESQALDSQVSAPQAQRVTGDAFHSDGFKPAVIPVPHTQRLPHYGAVSAKVELTTGVKEANVRLSANADGDAAPVVRVRMEAGDGSGRSYMLRPEGPVSQNDSYTTSVVIPAGKYTVDVEYYRATKPDQRPALDVIAVQFM